MEDTAPVVFSEAELWVIRNTCRHEVVQRDNWKHPPADFDLNTSVAFALAICQEHGLGEYTLPLTRHQCLVLDYNVPADVKDAQGNMLGKNILIKSFKARIALAHGSELVSDEPDDPEVRGRLDTYRKATE